MTDGPKLDISKTCNRKGCGESSRYQVGFSFRPIDGRPALPVQTSIAVCEAHKEAMTIDDVLTDDMRDACAAIMRGLNGIVDPSSYTLRFTAIQ